MFPTPSNIRTLFSLRTMLERGLRADTIPPLLSSYWSSTVSHHGGGGPRHCPQETFPEALLAADQTERFRFHRERASESFHVLLCSFFLDEVCFLCKYETVDVCLLINLLLKLIMFFLLCLYRPNDMPDPGL